MMRQYLVCANTHDGESLDYLATAESYKGALAVWLQYIAHHGLDVPPEQLANEIAQPIRVFPVPPVADGPMLHEWHEFEDFDLFRLGVNDLLGIGQ
jgi:hypothetical protein